MRSEDKVIWRSWWSMTRHLIVIHLHTKYHKSISKDKRVTAWIREFHKFNYLILRSEVNIMWRSWWSMTQYFMIIHLHTKYHMSMSKLKKVTTWIRKFHKINYLTLRSEVKDMWRSWWSIAQHIMIIQLHTKYHKSNSKDKSVTTWTRLFEYKKN